MSARNQATTAGSGGKGGPIIGIDLGTTNSLVAYCDEAGPRILADGQGERLLASVVRLSDSGQMEAIGEEARRHAVEYPRNTVFSVKRLMGRGIGDVEGELHYLPYAVVAGAHNTARVQVGEKVLSPQEISAMILARLRETAEAALGVRVRQAVITVPAYFDDAQRQATRDAGRIAGLQVMRIVNEPTAAALAYNIGHAGRKAALAKRGAGGEVALNVKINPAACATVAGGEQADRSAGASSAETVAVFDLGGGTFDISILRLTETEQGLVDQVLSTAGDTHLGGDDVDRMIVELIQREIREQFGEGIEFGPGTRQAFRNLAEATKIRLSDEMSAVIEVELPGGGGEARVYRRRISRDELEEMMRPWVGRTMECCKEALRGAKLGVGDIDRVVMVGGSTRIPLVYESVARFFETEPYTALNPEEVVALGAAVQGSILAGINRDMLLLDVIPLSLGIETMGGAVAKVITANSTIPARATEMFSTYVDGQTNVKIHVLQGERELVKDCRSLGQFDLRGIVPMPAGLPKIEVTFLVDANGILSVQAVEKRSEKRAAIQIVPNYGLTREEVDRMERESYAHAVEDMTAHRLIDLRNQARLDMRAIARQLAKVGEELDGALRGDIEEKMRAVQGFVDAETPDAEAFAQALTAMDHATTRLAELAIAKTLREDQAERGLGR
jgi:molecular chaperone DnaK (HSP70)